MSLFLFTRTVRSCVVLACVTGTAWLCLVMIGSLNKLRGCVRAFVCKRAFALLDKGCNRLIMRAASSMSSCSKCPVNDARYAGLYYRTSWYGWISRTWTFICVIALVVLFAQGDSKKKVGAGGDGRVETERRAPEKAYCDRTRR